MREHTRLYRMPKILGMTPVMNSSASCYFASPDALRCYLTMKKLDWLPFDSSDDIARSEVTPHTLSLARLA